MDPGARAGTAAEVPSGSYLLAALAWRVSDSSRGHVLTQSDRIRAGCRRSAVLTARGRPTYAGRLAGLGFRVSTRVEASLMLSRLLLALTLAARAVLIPGESGGVLSAPMTWSDLLPSPAADGLDVSAKAGARHVWSA